jgi:hypothetical protein
VTDNQYTVVPLVWGSVCSFPLTYDNPQSNSQPQRHQQQQEAPAHPGPAPSSTPGAAATPQQHTPQPRLIRLHPLSRTSCCC